MKNFLTGVNKSGQGLTSCGLRAGVAPRRPEIISRLIRHIPRMRALSRAEMGLASTFRPAGCEDGRCRRPAKTQERVWTACGACLSWQPVGLSPQASRARRTPRPPLRFTRFPDRRARRLAAAGIRTPQLPGRNRASDESAVERAVATMENRPYRTTAIDVSPPAERMLCAPRAVRSPPTVGPGERSEGSDVYRAQPVAPRRGASQKSSPNWQGKVVKARTD